MDAHRDRPAGTELRPTPSAMRRVLRRARDSVALDRIEAELLLTARGEGLGVN
ncbi:hypothetical protein ACI784_23995 [Geodermatophilus sp. SYSU D01186]